MRHIQRPLTLRRDRNTRVAVPKSCRHHWLIETPNGPTSPGRCKLCGERKLFMNHDPHDNLPPDWNRWYGGKE